MLEGPEVQIQLLRLQVVDHSSCWAAVWGSKAWRGVWGGQDVVNAEFDLRFWFAERWVSMGDSVVRRFRAERIRVEWPSQRVLMNVRDPEAFCWLPEAQLNVAAAPAAPKVAIFKQVQHGLAARGESPVISFPFLITLSAGNLEKTHNRRFLVKQKYRNVCTER